METCKEWERRRKSNRDQVETESTLPSALPCCLSPVTIVLLLDGNLSLFLSFSLSLLTSHQQLKKRPWLLESKVKYSNE